MVQGGACRARAADRLRRCRGRVRGLVMLAGGLLVLDANGQPARALEDRRSAGAPFAQWVSGLWPEARARGVSRATFERAFQGVAPDRTIAASNNAQPEFTRAIWDYLDKAISAARVRNGRYKVRAYRSTLDRIEAQYGVSKYVLAAIWGMESAYGRFIGGQYVVRSLATLGYRGRRRAFGRKQVLAALEMMQRGEVSRARFVGSWAGALGQTQILPSQFLQHAVDFDGDGRRDLWGTPGDALASAAALLKALGWQAGEPVLDEVRLPQKFDYALADIASFKSIADWRSLGVRRADGVRFARLERSAAIILPAGARGPAIMVYRNFHVVRRYNISTAYALGIGHLANRLRGAAPLRGKWPRRGPRLSVSQIEELQRLLVARGFDTGGVDGRLGPKTRRAVARFQRKAGLRADGYPTPELLEHLREK